jgi:diguanylate cyclase (GGDEF)-like protein
MEEILEERASKVFFILLLIMLLAFIVFNRFIAHILKPMNRNMQTYVESSLFDELTKLPNRRFFNMKMEDELSRAARAEYPISCMMMDLDKFKSYNDTHGHAGGDALLREAAKVFKSSTNRAQDFIARVGGEEFCAILPNTDLDGAKQVAERIRAGMEKTGKATISIGLICRIPTRRDIMDDLIKDADDKLYQAKNTGRNKVVF